jgi:ABC-type multidrug transport system permease subunit
MSWQRFYAVLVARNREFLRDRSALAWNILLPALIVMGVAFGFSGEPAAQYKIGYYSGKALPQTEAQLQALRSDEDFFRTPYLQFVLYTDLQLALTKVERHQLDMLLDLHTRQYWINQESPKGYLLEKILLGSHDSEKPRQSHSGFQRATVSGRAIRYIDWLIPGVLAMNMMFSALFGVGYVIVRYRKSGVLKRLRATPLTAFEFLSAQVVSRLWLILAISIAVYVGADVFVNFSMHGAYWHLLLVAILGSISMISLGLLIAARTASEELAGGLLNLLTWPMMFLSGVWFSLEGLHPLLQNLAAIFPLTHTINAARAIMIDGAGLADIGDELLIITAMSAVFLLLGSVSFRWEQK